MEVESGDGTRIRIKPGTIKELGRDDGLGSSDKTISRRHLSFFLPGESNNQELHLQFEVLGRNPVYVSKDNEVKIFRRFERGEMGAGDMFCVSAKNPVWYTVREIEKNGGEGVRRNALESELDESLESDLGVEGADYLHADGVDISDVDPVKEFGFVVTGHEFDYYPKKMIKDIKNWDWFLEVEGKDSDDDDDGDKGKSRRRRKRKKGTTNDDADDEWTGESEDDKVLIDKSRKDQRAKYKTRSKDHGKPSKNASKNGPTSTKNREVDDDDDDDDEEEEEDEDEGDETLGGFIVDDENLEEEEGIDDEEEELRDEDVEDEDE